MEKILYSAEQIQEACKNIAGEITKDLANEERPPLFLGVMKGALPFLHDMIKYIEFPMFLDYIQVSSYSGTKSTGKVKLLKDLTYDVANRTIIIVEDIVDSGLSMKYLVEHLMTKYKPKQVLVCALFDKTIHRSVDVEVKYKGFTLEKDYFLCGYGLDYNEIYRNIPYVFVPSNEDIVSMNKIIKR